MSGWFSWLERNRTAIPWIATCVVLLIGLFDYFAGYEVSFSVIYVIPIALAAWYSGSRTAYTLSVLSVLVWSAGDLATGWPVSSMLVPTWNALIRLVFYYVIIEMLVYIRSLTSTLEIRAVQRALQLNNEIAERQRLERELLEVSERERRRLGYDLHDGLCQHLTGTALAVQVLREKLQRQGLPEAAEAGKAVQLVQEAIDLSRRMAKNLQPIELQAGGLMQALQEFASATGDLFKVSCRFECESPVLVPNIVIADHLYRIAQEAVGNAVKHGQAAHIVISLDINDEGTLLRVEDDGVGLPQPLPTGGGMGLKIMAQRAKLIGALFDIRSSVHGGTMIACSLPHAAAA